MIEAGAPDTVKLLLRFRYRCARPTGGRMVAPPEVPRNAEGAQRGGRARKGNPTSAARDSIEAAARKPRPGS